MVTVERAGCLLSSSVFPPALRGWRGTLEKLPFVSKTIPGMKVAAARIF